MTNNTAESRCLCGKVGLQFLRPAPLTHLHCCCADCRQGQEWIASIGGPPMKHAYVSAYYFANDLAPLKPEALSLLFAVKLRENGRTTRLVSKCCHSVLGLDHPYYEKNVVCVHEDRCELLAPRIAPICRIFSKDWDTAYDGPMPSETAALQETQALWKTFESIVKKPMGEPNGVRIQEILEQLPPPTNLGLVEKARLLPPTKTKA